MNPKPLALCILMVAGASLSSAADRAGIGLYVWSADQGASIAEKTRMRLIVDLSTGDPVVLLRDFSKGTSLRAIVNEVVGELRGKGLAVTERVTPEGRALLTVKGARALRVSYSPSTVLTELADARHLQGEPIMLGAWRPFPKSE